MVAESVLSAGISSRVSSSTSSGTSPWSTRSSPGMSSGLPFLSTLAINAHDGTPGKGVMHTQNFPDAQDESLACPQMFEIS